MADLNWTSPQPDVSAVLLVDAEPDQMTQHRLKTPAILQIIECGFGGKAPVSRRSH